MAVDVEDTVAVQWVVAAGVLHQFSLKFTQSIVKFYFSRMVIGGVTTVTIVKTKWVVKAGKEETPRF